VIHIVRALAVLVLLALHIPVSAHATSILDDLIVGSEITGRLKIGMVTVPLPPDAWTVVNVNERLNSDLLTFAATDLIQFVDGKIVGALNISTNLDNSPKLPGWRPLNECSGKNAWFVRNDANYVHDQRCWIINHVAIPQTSKYTPTRGVNLQQWSISHNAAPPSVAVYSFFRFADQGKFLNYRIYENPELAGFAPEPSITWENSAWHRDVLSRDPARVAYLEQVKARHAGIYTELSRQFR
jgi:hypothetical protein